MPSIKKQSILIIGGTSGIGFAVAELALEQGVHVAIASSNPTRLSTALSKLHAAFPSASATAHEIDLRAPDVEARLLALFNAATDNRSTLLDHVVYTAVGPINMTPLEQLGVEDLVQAGYFHRVVPLLLSKVAPGFLHPGFKSSLILTSGQIAEKPIKGWTAQSGSAAAAYAITRGLAVDLAPRRVNCVSPGATMTELWGGKEDRERRAEMMGQGMLLGKVGSPEEVAEAYVYLMRDWNATGTVVNSNGGSLLK